MELIIKGILITVALGSLILYPFIMANRSAINPKNYTDWRYQLNFKHTVLGRGRLLIGLGNEGQVRFKLMANNLANQKYQTISVILNDNQVMRLDSNKIPAGVKEIVDTSETMPEYGDKLQIIIDGSLIVSGKFDEILDYVL